MKIDYSTFYRNAVPIEGTGSLGQWDVFISAFNSSERVQAVFDRCTAREKHWLVFPHYGYEQEHLPRGERVFADEDPDESQFLMRFLSTVEQPLKTAKVCVDITGFMRPHLLLLLRLLQHCGVSKFEALYSEPRNYSKKELTSFSKGAVIGVRPVPGYEGSHETDMAADVVVIGMGYDHELVSHVAESKDSARVVQVLAFPSLSPDMYQQSILRTAKAEESFQARCGSTDRFFASANDPFAAAAVLSEIYERYQLAQKGNFYISPLATKPQALGFGLYYLWELSGLAASIIFPYSNSYAQETTKGFTRLWKYEVPLPKIGS